MKISVVTVCLNSVGTIRDTIDSILMQGYGDIEPVVIDGGSTDGTQNLVASYRSRIQKLVSEPDHGIYDAMNKGVQLATGEIVAFLNADDVYIDRHVISDIVAVARTGKFEAVYGDLLYVRRDNLGKVVRYWKAGEYLPGAFRLGWVPPHPSFFCRTSVFRQAGGFDTSYRLAGDFELMLRLIEKQRIRLGYLPRPLVRMRIGGNSNTIRGIIWGNNEILRAFSANGLWPSPSYFWRKPFSKIVQFGRKPAGGLQ
jgi:glycosyltransferase involved in cell wall biosynthesis